MQPRVVVVVQPSLQHLASVVAAAVGLRVGPFAQHGLDEPFGLAVGAGPVGLGADVGQPAAGGLGGPQLADIRRAVVGHHLLDRDPALGEPGDRPSQEPDRSGRRLVSKHLDVGESAGVVDGDVHGLPAGLVGVSAGADTENPLAGLGEASQRLHVQMHQLTRMPADIPVRRLDRVQPGQPVEPEPVQHRADGGHRHLQCGGDRRARHPRSAQPLDHRLDLLRRAARARLRPRRPVRHRLAGVIANEPAVGGALGDVRRLRRIDHRPTQQTDPLTHQLPTQRSQPGVSVRVHRAPCERGRLDTPDLQGARPLSPDEPPWELQLVSGRRQRLVVSHADDPAALAEHRERRNGSAPARFRHLSRPAAG